MKIAVYGYGKFGKYVEQQLLMCGNDTECIVFIDNNVELQNTKTLSGKQIVSVDEFWCKWKKQVECVLVAALYEIFSQEMVLSLYGKGYRDIWVLPSNVWSGELPIINEDGNFYGYVKRFDEIMPTLYHATYSVSDHCNLKCKRCAYFSNLVNETVFADLDEFKEDLLGLKRRFFNVESFVLVGGEPFLNPDIDGFIYAVREAFPYSRLTIITNGLLLPSLAPKVIKAIRTCGVLVRISQYPPTRKMVDKILKFGWDNNIEILILNPINKFEQTVSYQNTDYVKAWENCTSNRCYHLRGHRLYNCPQIVYRYENREFLDLDTSEALRNQCSVDIVNGNENGWEILQKICNPVELCRYCPAEVKLADWESTERNKPIDKMDWVADD